MSEWKIEEWEDREELWGLFIIIHKESDLGPCNVLVSYSEGDIKEARKMAKKIKKFLEESES